MSESVHLALAAELSKHDFVDKEIVAGYVKPRISVIDGNPMYKADNGAYLPLGEGIATLAASKPHLVNKQRSGSGFSPVMRGNDSHANNPFVPGPNFNLTEQGRIARKDPAKARRMAAAAKR